MGVSNGQANSKAGRHRADDWIACPECAAKVKFKNMAAHRAKKHPPFHRTPKGRASFTAALIVLVVVAVVFFPSYRPDPDDQEDGVNNGSEEETLQRTVLVESFTAVDCYWCNEEEEPALKRIVQDYRDDDVVIIAYHGFYGDDPYETAEGNQRAGYYGGISGTPNVWVDGVLNQPGATGQGVDAMYGVYAGYIDHRSSVSTQLSMELYGGVSKGAANVVVKVNASGEVDTAGLSVRFALLEDGLRYSGKTFDWVLRDLKDRSVSGPTWPMDFEQNFQIDESWDPDNLGAAVWVQDDANREVVQAAFVGLG